MSLVQEAIAVPASDTEDEIRARHYLAPIAVGVFGLVTMLTVAAAEGLPIRDPDARYVGSPLALIALIVTLFIGLDVIVRTVRQASASQLSAMERARVIFSGRWWNRRGMIVLLAIVGFYATYLSYRNLKSFLPFVTDGRLHDLSLVDLDKIMAFGAHPSTLLHDILGTQIAAPVLSEVYLAFLTFVPLSLGFALVWSSRLAAGVWYVTALTFDWLLGVLSYYLLPTLGPAYARPDLFSDLPSTGVSRLQQTLLEERGEVTANPHHTDAVQSIAGFASLHVAVIFTAALVVQLVGAPKLMRVLMWVYFALTCLSTVYFGWHYLVDDIAGVAIGLVAVYAGAFLVGFRPPPFGSLEMVKRRSTAGAPDPSLSKA